MRCIANNKIKMFAKNENGIAVELKLPKMDVNNMMEIAIWGSYVLQSFPSSTQSRYTLAWQRVSAPNQLFTCSDRVRIWDTDSAFGWLSRSTVPPRVEYFTENSVRSSDVAYFVWALKPDRECHAIISGLAFWSDYYVLCWFWCAKVYTCYAVGNFMLHTGVGFITTIKCEIKTCNINDTASRNSGATSIRLSDLYWITKLSHGDDSGKSYSNYTPWGELSDELRVA